MSAERVLPPRQDRRRDAETWLGDLLEEWGVRAAPPARWLAPASGALEQPDELVAFAQYDPVLLLFTLELWSSGRRVYGIDDWLG